jgi:glycosyltransferase involved in cell wall biosynthesis
MKLVVLTNILAPYRNPLFREMSRLTDEFTVVLMADNESNRFWALDDPGFRTIVLPGFHVNPLRAETPAHVNYRVMRTLRSLDPDVVLSGGFTFANISAFLYCRRYRKRFVQWASLTMRDGAESSFVMRNLRRILSKHADGCVSESTESVHAFIRYGMSLDRITTALVPFEVQALHDRVREYRGSAEHARLRAEFPGPILLSIGQLIPRKGYTELFAIYSQLLKTRPDAFLLIVGEGASRAEYEQTVRERGWNQVHFVGYVQANDLRRYLGIADLFVFHTRYDCYGLVSAEAMAAEVPVVASIHAASTADLIDEGVTGFRIDPYDTEHAVAQILRALSMDVHAQSKMKAAAYRKITPCDIMPSARRIISFLENLSGSDRAHSRGGSTTQPASPVQ